MSLAPTFVPAELPSRRFGHSFDRVEGGPLSSTLGEQPTRLRILGVKVPSRARQSCSIQAGSISGVREETNRAVPGRKSQWPPSGENPMRWERPGWQANLEV
jgi:hypothetical protein